MYQEWCENNGCGNNITKNTFNKKIEENGITKKKVAETDGDKRSYVGFEGIKPPHEYLDRYLKRWGTMANTMP